MDICKKAILCFCTVCSLILSQLFLVSHTSVYATPVLARSTVPDIFLEWDQDSATDIFMLWVMLEPDSAELCGLELDITYDTNIFILSSCERGDALDGLKFDCSLSDEKIRLLFWGETNSCNGGRLATICFAPNTNVQGTNKCEFILSMPTTFSAIYFDGDGIYTTDVSLRSISVQLENNLQDDHEPPPADIATEAPTQQHTEAPTQIYDEEPLQKLPSGTDDTISTDNTFAKGSSKILICILFAVNAPAFLPYLFRDIFRKGYF